MILLSVALALLFAQQTERLSVVEGKVLDGATNQPVSGARVILARFDRPGWGIGGDLLDTQPSAREQDPKANRLAVITGDDGGFRFRIEGPAQLVLFANAAGYVKPMLGMGPDNMYEVAAGALRANCLTEDAPVLACASGTAALLLARCGWPLRRRASVLG